MFNATLPLFSKDYNREHRKAKMTRFLLIAAGPIDLDGVRYNNLGDRQPEQEFLIANWQVSLNERLKEIETKYPGYVVHCFGRAYVYRFFYKQLVYDLLWAILSGWLVYSVLLLHTKSFFVATTSVS